MAETSASSEILLSAAVTTWLLLQIRCATAAGLPRLAERTSGNQFADPGFVVTEDIFEHVLIVLAETRRLAANCGRSPREFRARTFDRKFSVTGMRERDEMPAMYELRIGVRVGAALHLMRRNAVRLKPGFDRAALDCTAPRGDRRVDCVAMLESSGGGGVARVARQVLIFHCEAEAAPVVIIATDDRDPLVVTGRGIDAVRREGSIGISDASLDAAVHGVVENRRAKKMDRAFSLRLIDILPFTRASPMVERRENCHRREPRRDVVRVRAEDAGRSAVGPSGESVTSRNRGRHVAEAGDLRQRPRLSHQ